MNSADVPMSYPVFMLCEGQGNLQDRRSLKWALILNAEEETVTVLAQAPQTGNASNGLPLQV